MFNFGALAANVLNSLDNAAKDTLEEPRMSATALRSQRRGESSSDEQHSYQSDDEDNLNEGPEGLAPPIKPPLVVRHSSSNSLIASNPHGNKSIEKFTSPPKSISKGLKEKQPQNDYALSFESTANSSNVSNDGDNAGDENVGTTLPANLSSSQLSESAEPTSIAMTSPFVADEPIPPSIPSTPVSSSAKHVDSEQAEQAEALPAVAVTPAATPAAAPTGLLGSIVNTLGSAKKLATTPAVAAPPAAVTSAADSDKAAKDSNKDKEILLLKKTLKKKNAEIEKLNRECLDLEEQTSALKLEVQEAWSNYKTSQEKAAAVESELQDEIRQIQKAKLSDKQISVAQLSKMGEEVAEAMRQVSVAQAQRAEVQSKLDAAVAENSLWEERLAAVQDELSQAQTGTVQGVAALREELRVMQANTEQMRVDHSSLLRQNQLRQAELERENAELVASLTQQQKELQRLQHQNSTGNTAYSSLGGTNGRDYVTLQQELIELTASFEKERDRSEDLDRRLRIAEREARAAQMTFEDEKRRNCATIDELGAKLADLEGKNNSRRAGNKGATGATTGFLLSAGSNQEGGENEQEKYAEHAQYATNNTANSTRGGSGAQQSNQLSIQDYEAALKELQDQRLQSQNLSKLLLKKQGTVLELQAERSALKSRLIDMQARCSEAERQLASMRDLEGGDFGTGADGNDDAGADVGTTSSSGGALLRRGNGSGHAEHSSLHRRSSRDTKVISDLERFGVKPGASVTRAVNMIDTWTIVTGRFLRVYPLARLGFVFYLLLLHLWVLFILVMQTHSLELDTDPHEQVMHS